VPSIRTGRWAMFEPHSESYVDSEEQERCATCDKWLEPGYYDIEDHFRTLKDAGAL